MLGVHLFKCSTTFNHRTYDTANFDQLLHPRIGVIYFDIWQEKSEPSGDWRLHPTWNQPGNYVHLHVQPGHSVDYVHFLHQNADICFIFVHCGEWNSGKH